MCTAIEQHIAWGKMFRRLFDPSPAHAALLDLSGIIIETNDAWNRFGRDNGIPQSYTPIGKSYLQICEAAADSNWQVAQQAYLGLREVMHLQRPKFTMVYACHSPTQRQWYRMWVQPQMPAVPVIVVAHYFYISKELDRDMDWTITPPAGFSNSTIDAN